MSNYEFGKLITGLIVAGLPFNQTLGSLLGTPWTALQAGKMTHIPEIFIQRLDE